MITDFNDRLKSQECITCGITFAITETMVRHLRETLRPFQCPNGHEQSYKGQLQIDRLKAEIDKANGRAQWWEERANERLVERDELQRRVRSLRGVITRMKAKTAAP